MRSKLRLLAALAAVCFAAACGGGGGGGDAAAGNGGPGTQPESPAGDDAGVTVSGKVTFDFVPSRAGHRRGLAYEDTEAKPVRLATVEAVAGTDIVAAKTTDETGAYALELPADTQLFLRVRAEMVRTGGPAWDVRLVDNTSDAAPYVLDGATFDTGGADSTRDLHAPSGWTGSSYGAERAAAPFAILDTVYDSMRVVLAVDPGVTFPPLVVNWSPDNVPTRGDVTIGEIGSSFYRQGSIYILGAEDSDTDEYDRHVVAHEWGHYFEDSFSRSDSIGGRHTFGDRLDMRTAFGEGFGNAFSGIVTGDPLYVDASGSGQSDGFGFDIEGDLTQNPAPGWYSEQSVHEMLWDAFDARNLEDTGDADRLTLGFAPLYAVLTGPQAATPALTSVFSFFAALKAHLPGHAAAIDALTTANDIEPVADAFGTTEDNDAGTTNHNVIPVYRSDLAVNGGPVTDVCSTNEFESDYTGAENKLGSRRFLTFDVPAAGSHTITVTTIEKPAGEFADPDFVVHRGGAIHSSTGPPSETCKAGAVAQECTERTLVSLQAGTYVLEVYEWTNTNESDDEDYPPIGRTCFDVEVTRP